MNISKKESSLNKQNKTIIEVNGESYTDVLIEQVWDVDGKLFHTLLSWNHEDKNGEIVLELIDVRLLDHVITGNGATTSMARVGML